MKTDKHGNYVLPGWLELICALGRLTSYVAMIWLMAIVALEFLQRTGW